MRDLVLKIEYIAFLLLPTRRCSTLTNCWALRGMKFQTTFFCARNSWIRVGFYRFATFRNSPAAPSKLVPLSLTKTWSLLGIAMNLVSAIMHASVSKPSTTSMWTAGVVQQINRQHHILKVFSRNKTANGAKYSVLVFWKAYENPFNLSFGRSANSGCFSWVA